MNEQINLRLPPLLLKDARKKAKQNGFGTVQAYIEQAVRADIYDVHELSAKETGIIERLMKTRGDPRFWATEEEYHAVIKKKTEELQQSRSAPKKRRV